MPVWEVVGGLGKGGILVREGQALQSKAIDERLTTGSLIHELELEDGRLHYRLVRGTGPRQGWVSCTLSGKDLVVPKPDYESPLCGVWTFGADKDSVCISQTQTGLLRVDMRWPPVTDLFGVLQPEEQDWLATELRPKKGEVMCCIRLRYDFEAESCFVCLRQPGEVSWGAESLASKSDPSPAPSAQEARPWSEKLQNAHQAALQAMQESLGGDGSEAWPQLQCKRLVAWSDLHIDMGENMRHLKAVERQEATALILSGDMCTSLSRLEEALCLCVERFEIVFYVPGNHELWAEAVQNADGQRRSSLDKFVEILRLCSKVGVRTSPAFISQGVAVCPLFSWYTADFVGHWVDHGGFDNTCYWPEVDADNANNPQSPEISDFFLTLNHKRVEQAAVLKQREDLKTLWTFSHFLPRPDLYRGGGFLLGCLGCAELDEQVRKAGATGHLFGHSHQGTERFYDGVRYVQQPLGYPTDGAREECPLVLWEPH